jgi:hypothetical protein
MSVYTALSHLATEWRSAREEARTRRIISSLPAEIQKDIGWPDAQANRVVNRSRGAAFSDHR